MKKIQINSLQNISGGLKCGTVGVLAGLSSAAAVLTSGLSLFGLYYLSSDISRCLNDG